jgi:hypothetical protein
MQPKINTVVIQSEACETAILGKARCEGRPGVARRPRTKILISDEQAAMITKGLQELVRLSHQIDQLWQQINESVSGAPVLPTRS